jgi:hypothetical protein
MATNVTGTGNTWNLPNYSGELFTASPTQTPLLSMIGGLTGGMMSQNDEFATGVLYEFPTPEQPEISETASETAPSSTALVRAQETNVTQIFQETVAVTYAKMANSGKLSGINSANQDANPPSELDWQITQRLIKIARDVEYTFINGVYQKATSANVANKTRGLVELCSTGTTVAAANAELSTALLKELYKAMADGGAAFDNMVLFCNSTQKQKITELYEKQVGYNTPATRNVGGMNITEIETDFFRMGVVYDSFVPADTILIADVAHIAPVFQEVPDKGVLFLEDLSKTGAAEKKQIYGQIGLAHGPAFLHGTITGLATK